MNTGFLLLLLLLASDTPNNQPPQPLLANAAAVTPVLDPSGRLWLAWVDGQTLYVNHSDDLGQTLSKPVAVNAEPQTIAARGENRPALVVADNGDVLTAYTKRLPVQWSGDLMFSRSTDGGVTFQEPRKINDDAQVTSHAFVTMNQSPNGNVYLAWLDGRDRLAAKAMGQSFTGTSLYGTFSKDRGITFSPNQSLAGGTCQCCRLAMSFNTRGEPKILWRHIFDDHMRDHGIGTWTAEGFTMNRFHRDGWRLEGCPHQGPAMATTAKGRTHAAWFTTRDETATLLYAAMEPNGLPVGTPQTIAEGMHPSLVSAADGLYLAWMTTHEADVVIQWAASSDYGRTWSPVKEVGRTSGMADYPFLLKNKGHVYCFWFADGRIKLTPLKLG